MGTIDRLPGGGKKFRATAGAGNFKSKLKVAVNSSSILRPLSDNQEQIVKAVRKYQNLIRAGKFGYSQRNTVLSQVVHNSPTKVLSSEKILLKKILKHLSEDSSKSLAHVNRSDDPLNEDNESARRVHLSAAPDAPHGFGATPSAPTIERKVRIRPMVSAAQAQKQAAPAHSSPAANQAPPIPLSRSFPGKL